MIARAHERGPAYLVDVKDGIAKVMGHKGFLELLVAIAGLRMVHWRIFFAFWSFAAAADRLRIALWPSKTVPRLTGESQCLAAETDFEFSSPFPKLLLRTPCALIEQSQKSVPKPRYHFVDFLDHP